MHQGRALTDCATLAPDTKGNVCMIKELNSQRISWVHQHGRRSVVYRYTNMAAVTSRENTIVKEKP